MANFHDTVMGSRFYQHDIPQLIRNIGRLADAAEKANEIASAANTPTNSEESYGYKKFKNILASNVSIDAIRTFVQNNDDEYISDSLSDAFPELLASEGCCPHCGSALMYSDDMKYDYICTSGKCNSYLNHSEIAALKTKSPIISAPDKSNAPQSIPGARVRLGDEVCVNVPFEQVDCTSMTFFDTLEDDCFQLIKSYAEAFGLELTDGDGNLIDEDVISFDLAKEVQETIINIFVKAGIPFKFNKEEE